MTTRPSMGRRAVTNVWEQDAYTGWRRVLCCLKRPGAVRSIKRMTHRRERREAREEIRAQMGEQ